ncbi:MAG: hypothetical protein ACFFAJ_05255, partial [Candidatus Hodarchaeota archaeon]
DSDKFSQQQPFDLSLENKNLADFYIDQLEIEIHTLEKLLEEVESLQLLDTFRIVMEDSVSQVLDIETIPEHVDSLELVSQGPTLPEAPSYDFLAELEKWEEEVGEQVFSVRGQLLRSLEEAKRVQATANYNFALQNSPISGKQTKNQSQKENTVLKDQTIKQKKPTLIPSNINRTGLRKGEVVTIDGRKITLAIDFGTLRFEPKICYRELIVYSWVKNLFHNNTNEALTFSRHEAVDEIKEFAKKAGFRLLDTYQLIGPVGVRTALNRMRAEGIIDATIRAKTKLNEITIRSALTMYNDTPVVDTFRYFLARSYEGLHRTAKSKRSDEILELIKVCILPKLIDGYPVLNLTKINPKIVLYWESIAGTIKFKEILDKLYSYALNYRKLPHDSKVKNWLMEAVNKSEDRFEIASGKLKSILSDTGKKLSAKYHVNKEHFKNGQHKFLELLNKEFNTATITEKDPQGLSYIHPKLKGAKITRSTIEQSSGNTLFISSDMNGALPDGRKINVITKGSSKQNLSWQTLEQAFLDDIRIIQFINENKMFWTGKIVSVIIDDTLVKKSYVENLKTLNMIFHDIIKKGAAVPSTRDEFLSQKTLDTVFDRTIKDYGKNSIEYSLWNEFQEAFSKHFIHLHDGWILQRGEFEAFWIIFMYERALGKLREIPITSTKNPRETKGKQ